VQRPLVIVLWYAVAFAAGAGLMWLGSRFALRAFLAGPDSGNLWMIIYVLPLAAMAVFQLIIGSATGLMRGWWFWVIGGPVLHLTVFGGMGAIEQQLATPIAAIICGGGVIFALGLLALLREAGVNADAG
jgi:hypothetical protein